MWIANDIWKNDKSVKNYDLNYNTALGVIFGIPKYANELMKLVESENVKLNKEHILSRIDYKNSKFFSNSLILLASLFKFP